LNGVWSIFNSGWIYKFTSQSFSTSGAMTSHKHKNGRREWQWICQLYKQMTICRYYHTYKNLLVHVDLYWRFWYETWVLYVIIVEKPKWHRSFTNAAECRYECVRTELEQVCYGIKWISSDAFEFEENNKQS
jgi:hypothetical protein